jgi:hypothetical protein
MAEHPELYDETVTIERAASYNQEYLCNHELTLGRAEVVMAKIEDGYG